jgi:hypothetical protein
MKTLYYVVNLQQIKSTDTYWTSAMHCISFRELNSHKIIDDDVYLFY